MPITKPNPTPEAMPVTTMVEVPVLSAEERGELIASLERAEAEIRESHASVMTGDEFSLWLARASGEANAKKRAQVGASPSRL